MQSSAELPSDCDNASDWENIDMELLTILSASIEGGDGCCSNSISSIWNSQSEIFKSFYINSNNFAWIFSAISLEYIYIFFNSFLTGYW